jgi:hypothetical protein
LEAIETCEFLAKAFHLDPDQPIQSVADFIGHCPSTVQPQQFHVELPETPIDPEACRVVAYGGRKTSYMIGGLIDVTVSDELKLRKANRQPAQPNCFRADWDWKSLDATASPGPECTFHLKLISAPSMLPLPKERCDELLGEYFSERRNKEIGHIETDAARIYWIQTSASEGDGERIMCELIFVGMLSQNAWELWIHVSRRDLERFREEAIQVVRSIRLGQAR